MSGTRDRLSDITVQDVKGRLTGETNGQAIKRLIAVWEYLNGDSTTRIEARYRHPDGTVEAWLDVVAEEGLDALLAKDSRSPSGPRVGHQKRLVHTEEKLRSLQETTRELMVATTTDDVIDTALSACVDILGMPISVFWKYDDERDALVAYQQTEYGYVVMGTLPTQPFERGNGIVWRAVKSGDVQYWEDLWEVRDELFDPDTDLRSEIDVPLGEYGALGMGSMSPSEFDVVDVDLCRILGRAVESAFDRAERERRLERKTQQLATMAEVVSHDLRSPLDGGATRLRMLKETLEEATLESARRETVDEHLEAIGGSLNRASDIAGQLLTMTRDESTQSYPVSTDIRTVASDVWETVETGDLELSFRGSRTVDAREERLRHLFENCVRNVVEHADADTVRIGATPNGFFVEDDGRGIPEDRREQVLERGYTTTPDGTGLGLAIVAEIAAEHDWQVGVTEGTAGGARIEVYTDIG